MSEGKKYFWLKLQQDFFGTFEVKRMRRLPHGESCVLVYLKILLRSIRQEGVIEYSEIVTDYVDELALDIDEPEDVVKETLDFLEKRGLAVREGDQKYLFPYAVENTGKEGASAERMRRLRERGKASKCDDEASKCDDEASKCAQRREEKRKEELYKDSAQSAYTTRRKNPCLNM